MNINFRDHPDPHLNKRGLMTHGQYELPHGKTTYLVCRHTPHPKTVCHIRGLNDVPICVVRDRGCFPGHLDGIPGSEQTRHHLSTQTAPDIPFPTNALTGQVHNAARGKAQLRDDFLEYAKRTGNPAFLNRKDDPLRQFLDEHPESKTAQEIQPLQAIHYRPDITDNINYTPSFLDQEVKILEKLHDILQTDSIADIKQWLANASMKDKEIVSNFIRSDVTVRDLLNYRQKIQNETEAEKLNLPALMKAPKGYHKETPVEGSRSRISTQASTISRRSFQEKGREKMRIATSENVPVQRPVNRHNVQERGRLSPSSSKASTQMMYKRSSYPPNLPSRQSHLHSF